MEGTVLPELVDTTSLDICFNIWFLPDKVYICHLMLTIQFQTASLMLLVTTVMFLLWYPKIKSKYISYYLELPLVALDLCFTYKFLTFFRSCGWWDLLYLFSLHPEFCDFFPLWPLRVCKRLVLLEFLDVSIWKKKYPPFFPYSLGKAE